MSHVSWNSIRARPGQSMEEAMAEFGGHGDEGIPSTGSDVSDDADTGAWDDPENPYGGGGGIGIEDVEFAPTGPLGDPSNTSYPAPIDGVRGGTGGSGGGGSFSDSGGGGSTGGGPTPNYFPPMPTREVTSGGPAPGSRDMTRTDQSQYDPFQTSKSPYGDYEKRLLDRYENFDSTGLDSQISRERKQGLEGMRNSLQDAGLGGRGSGLQVAGAAEFLSGFNPAAMAARSGLQLQAMGQQGSAISGFGRDTFQPTKTSSTSREVGETGGGGGVQPSTGEKIVYNPYLNLR